MRPWIYGSGVTKRFMSRQPKLFYVYYRYALHVQLIHESFFICSHQLIYVQLLEAALSLPFIGEWHRARRMSVPTTTVGACLSFTSLLRFMCKYYVNTLWFSRIQRQVRGDLILSFVGYFASDTGCHQNFPLLSVRVVVVNRKRKSHMRPWIYGSGVTKIFMSRQQGIV